ncbi:two-component system VirA-like sensor kinase [Methylobacterium sp. 092160098-2]|uniref:two-component system VirA-like sensor kinase n=1 Tax=Methylobacterium sp. 092160098-2 TaxID=3025129 RepID=UPI002381A532|nr:two-component system VirA-like sensor kinase [Methylobacterium sp. 092160098-2]MDE4915220.1 two-component system VirA-like sensor kinase [Methylobacterium sp. 092160098-2]
MRLTLQALVLGVLLAGLLTWLLINGNGAMGTAYSKTRRTVDALALAESRLQHDVLRARMGLLRNYDPIVTHLREMQAALAVIRAASGLDDREVRVLAEAVSREAQMVERFKTGNALVQNSIAYFNSLSDRLSDPDTAPWLARSVAALQVQMAELGHDASRKRLEEFHAALDALTENSPTPDRAADINAIILHGRQLLDLLPQVEAVTRALPTFSIARALQNLLDAHSALRKRRQDRADGFRLALYAVALALLILVVRVCLLMRAGTAALRQTIAFQSVVAQAANRFLASQPGEISARISEILAKVGEGLGTDHGYVLMLDGTGSAYLWNRSGLSSPRGWPAAHRALIPNIVAAPDDLVIVETSGRIGPPDLLRSLAERGVTSWACARLRRGEHIVGLLCFERSTSDLPMWLRHSRGLLRIVADSFGAALERQHVWIERRQTEATLRRAQRLEAIGIFASGVAHNINNVLNVMLGHAEIAADALPSDPQLAARQIDQLVWAGGRACEITEQILDFGKRGSSTQRCSVVDAIVTETVSLIRSSAAHPAVIRLAGATDGAIVGGEPVQLQQLVHNLIRNAIQASSSQDAIDVRLDRFSLTQPHTLSHGVLRPGDHARIRVTDAGRGMDQDTIARIFEPFFTTRPGGTGLGLATAFEFVQEQNGVFDVRSVLGAGSVFEVWLPVIPATRMGATAGSTVLIIGRSRDAVREDEETLAALGYEPVGLADPEAAMAILRSEPRRFDLLIVESQLSGLSGFAFARRAALISNWPIVLSLPASEPTDPEDLSGIPIVDIARRPWRSNALALTLQRHLQKLPQQTGSSPNLVEGAA